MTLNSLVCSALTASIMIGTLAHASSDSISTARIVGGEKTAIANVPWQVAIGYFGEDTYEGQFCGGTILNDRWVASAAHCFFEGDGNRTTGTLMVTIGEADLSDVSTANQYSFSASDDVFIHPSYRTSSFDNDIALIRLPSTLDLDACGNDCEAIGWVTPENEAFVAPASTSAWVSGWGATARYTPDAFGNPPAGYNPAFDVDLKRLEVFIQACADTMDAVDFTDNVLCAGAADLWTEDSCQGDSGGPLAVANNEGTGYLLAGIVSYGEGCAAGEAGGYVRVANYDEWIETTIADNVSEPVENPDASDGPVPSTGRSGGGALPMGLFMLLLVSLLTLANRRQMG